MKTKILLSFLFFITYIFSLSAQETYYDFSIINQKLMWQHTYDSDLDFTSFVKKVKLSNVYSSIEIVDSMIIGIINAAPINYTGAGYTSLSVPLYVSGYDVKGFGITEYKKGKYRSTISDIKLVGTYNSNILESKMGDTSNIEAFILNNDKTTFKNQFKKAPASCFNHTFKNLFEFNNVLIDQNW
jgi:hypothetical protein